MRHAERVNQPSVRFWIWTPVAILATVLLMILGVLALPLVYVVTQLSLPRTSRRPAEL